MVKCDNCGTENGYPKERENVWFCRKCLHRTPMTKPEEIKDEIKDDK